MSSLVCFFCASEIYEPLPCGHNFHRECLIKDFNDSCLSCDCSLDLTREERNTVNHHCRDCKGELEEPLPCGHAFHRECMLSDLYDCCPICLNPIEVTSEEKEHLIREIKLTLLYDDYHDDSEAIRIKNSLREVLGRLCPE